MTTEDPNIATLRDYVRQGSVNGTTEQQDEEALRALQDLASKLAERDRRIAELALLPKLVAAIRRTERNSCCSCCWGGPGPDQEYGSADALDELERIVDALPALNGASDARG